MFIQIHYFFTTGQVLYITKPGSGAPQYWIEADLHLTLTDPFYAFCMSVYGLSRQTTK